MCVSGVTRQELTCISGVTRHPMTCVSGVTRRCVSGVTRLLITQAIKKGHISDPYRYASGLPGVLNLKKQSVFFGVLAHNIPGTWFDKPKLT